MFSLEKGVKWSRYAVGQVASQIEVLEQVVAVYHLTEKRGGNKYILYKLYLCKIGIICI